MARKDTKVITGLRPSSVKEDAIKAGGAAEVKILEPFVPPVEVGPKVKVYRTNKGTYNLMVKPSGKDYDRTTGASVDRPMKRAYLQAGTDFATDDPDIQAKIESLPAYAFGGDIWSVSQERDAKVVTETARIKSLVDEIKADPDAQARLMPVLREAVAQLQPLSSEELKSAPQAQAAQEAS